MTLIVKPTLRCNASCRYCAAHSSDEEIADMSPAILRLLFARIGEYLPREAGDEISILWHGGEPLLMGRAFYQSAAEHQERYCSADTGRIRHAMQTNLTLMTGAFAETLARLGLQSVGTSFDPVDGMRVLGGDSGSARYNRRFLRGLSCIEAVGIPWGLIYVVTRRSLSDPQGIFRCLRNLSATLNLNPVLDHGRVGPDLVLSPNEYSAFLSDVFPTWLREDCESASVQPFSSLMEAAMGTGGTDCMSFGACRISSDAVEVTPEGTVLALNPPGAEPQIVLGDLEHDSLKDLIEHNRDSVEDAVRKRAVDIVCEQCRFVKLCIQSPSAETTGQPVSFIVRDEWCNARVRFIEECVEPTIGRRIA